MSKRFLCLLLTITFLFTAAVGRLGYIAVSGAYEVSSGYNSYLITIDSNYPTLYYSDLQRINNNKNKYVAVIRQTERDIAELYTLFDYNQRQEIINELKNGYPVVRNIDSKYKDKTKSIKIYKINGSDDALKQLISPESGGMLSYLDKNYATKKVAFSIDAKGRLLSGDTGKLEENNYDSYYGFKLTIDKSVQQIAENACKDMKSGAAIVMDVKSSKILACVTKPDDSYINKCFANYCVGSVYKLVVAACALENNIDLTYTCKGSIKVNDSVFSCQGNHTHGTQTLKTALANSCNCYFVNLALTLGSDKILHTSQKFGFDSTINLFDDWSVKASKMPQRDSLTSKGQLALLGFGQGTLLASPLQICSTLCTIANNGTYNEPCLITSRVDKKGNLAPYSTQNSKSAIKKPNANTLVKYMRYVVSNGTGKAADTAKGLSAGKTATAQTGQFADGNELLNTWFAGVYPYNNPKYAIVIMTEQGTSGAKDCCPVFRAIVENLA